MEQHKVQLCEGGHPVWLQIVLPLAVGYPFVHACRFFGIGFNAATLWATWIVACLVLAICSLFFPSNR